MLGVLHYRLGKGIYPDTAQQNISDTGSSSQLK